MFTITLRSPCSVKHLSFLVVVQPSDIYSFDVTLDNMSNYAVAIPAPSEDVASTVRFALWLPDEAQSPAHLKGSSVSRFNVDVGEDRVHERLLHRMGSSKGPESPRHFRGGCPESPMRRKAKANYKDALAAMGGQERHANKAVWHSEQPEHNNAPKLRESEMETKTATYVKHSSYARNALPFRL